MTSRSILCKLMITSLLLALAGAAQAQALFVARKAIGRIEHMTQSSPPSAASTGASYDVATVIVDVAPDKVFDTAKRLLGESRELHVTRTDEAKHMIEFTDGTQIGGIQVNGLGDALTQLLISTAHPGVPSATTSTIVTRILTICRQLNVVCERSPS